MKRTPLTAVSVVIAVLCAQAGCDRKDSDFSFSGCKSDDTAPAAAIWVAGAFGDVATPPEEGESYAGLTCLTYSVKDEQSVEIGLINFWANCDGGHGGNIDQVESGQFEVRIWKKDCSDQDSCSCPYDFSFVLEEVDVAQDIDLTIVRDECGGGSNDYSFSASLPISTEETGIICWDVED